MPLTGKGEDILKSMEKTYGAEKGKQVLYASENKGTISGIHDAMSGAMKACADAVEHLHRRVDAYCARRADAARSDARMFPSYTQAQLEERLKDPSLTSDIRTKMENEVAARNAGTSQARVTPQIEGGRPMPKVGRL